MGLRLKPEKPWYSESRSALGPASNVLFVRVDPALAEWLQADPGKEALAGVGLSLDLERLFVEVKERMGRRSSEYPGASHGRRTPPALV